ncbi:hypothetical protein L198_01294 [Cryptococcus wingfieldii CBS 7118]|uniref:Uncharacterized protein n=1 Tax=Cryptococcus wingfieldii CBS 7118 TaxID=1295528 RepID=A0A1E3JZ73_9TREE|nr:hypothetical protein L198_01294 [Cryptococcus wingfieldii CBS 7118]ODO06065.1 hypothetical protein L198_01294 [Cryptococcus wingfieldii CBS 7118]
MFNVFEISPRFRFNLSNTVTRFDYHSNLDNEEMVAGVQALVGRDMIIVELPTTKLHLDVTAIHKMMGSRVEYMVDSCISTILEWNPDHSDSGPIPKGVIFTNFIDVLFRDGSRLSLTLDEKQGILDMFQRAVRRRIRATLENEVPTKVGMEDKVYVRGYEECSFCRRLITIV